MQHKKILQAILTKTSEYRQQKIPATTTTESQKLHQHVALALMKRFKNINNV